MTGPTVVAIGGNALVREGETGALDRQLDRARQVAAPVAAACARGQAVVLTHGNGPQVGFILRRGELVGDEAQVEGLPDLPLWLAVADSQGGMGHILCVALDAALKAQGVSSPAAVILTHAVVDPADPAFADPVKPIGGLLDGTGAQTGAARAGWRVRPAAGGRYRRVVASPAPLCIVEAEHVARLARPGTVVVAAGGGGIAVTDGPDGPLAVDAVIDKDRSSALLARQIGAGRLVLVTSVPQVVRGFGTPDARPLARVGVAQLGALAAGGEFDAGSMGPKVEAACGFVQATGGEAQICDLAGLAPVLAEDQGAVCTRVVPTSSIHSHHPSEETP
ncbi:MAG: carbamate kinase [Bifidobacteriaceae bacterium]|jgi:carbamate kinase|nr:carbamate kinase [Bifidobacteriaceae bacterium]